MLHDPKAVSKVPDDAGEMLTRDNRCEWVSEGAWFWRRWYCCLGEARAARGLSSGDYRDLLEQQESEPVAVLAMPRRTYWMFRGDYYRDEDGLDVAEVRALLLDRMRRRQRQIENAMARLEAEEAVIGPGRAPIPEEVRLAVWRRDGGRCVRCGGQRNLEFDHVIPVSLGGS
ncbi:MAG: hypothetical protein QOF51_622, partial [Chloroflexota bacterium]|nr:hypothetical protein [Chloroflexota bacterium]